MKLIKRNILLLLLTIALLVSGVPTTNTKAATRTLSKSQQYYADEIAQTAIDNWTTYGVLPSVAVAQAFIESTLGDHCSGNNLWGICSGAVKYSSLHDGIIGYLKVINNGYYKGAPGCKDYKTQLRRILDGGYCQPEGQYYSNAIWAIESYGFYKYDQKLFKILEKKERKEKARIAAEKKAKKEAKEKAKREKKQAHTYKVEYDENVPDHCIGISKEIVPTGTVTMMKDDASYGGIYDIYDTGKSDEYVVYTSDKELVGTTVELDVCEAAVG